MIRRSFPFKEDGAIQVTLNWDPGDPSGNLAPGWDEGTGVILTVGELKMDMVIIPDAAKPIDLWEIDGITVEMHDRIIWDTDGGGLLREHLVLLAAVAGTWEQFQAWEAIERAGEVVWDCETLLDELQERLAETGDGHHRLVVAAGNALEQAKSRYGRLYKAYGEQYGEQVMA